MTQAAAVVEALKRTLKARKLTYVQVARALRMSEASVKRMFSRNHFTLERLDRVCELAKTSLTELAREVDGAASHVAQLTPEQEREVVRDRKLFLVAVCVLNQLTLEQIVDTYNLSKTECIHLLLKLERIKFLELLPNNQVKLLVARTFSWLPDGPIHQYFKARAQSEYFRSRFDGSDEILLLVNGLLSRASGQAMLARLKRLANEFSEMHSGDASLPLTERRPASLVLAMRPWELDDFHALRRGKRPERVQRA
ncbi:MAG TPA: helix-turn-helix transcriptional regulator [Burkholderiales bacterium]|nr:helix-turn-helix transcriptional regulator [Burkholderiales bacterium]